MVHRDRPFKVPEEERLGLALFDRWWFILLNAVFCRCATAAGCACGHPGSGLVFTDLVCAVSGSASKVNLSRQPENSDTGGHIMLNRNVPLLIIVLAAPFAPASIAAIDYGVTSGAPDCRDVARTIISEWFTLKSLMSPGSKSLKRPRATEFQCISPYYVRDLLPKSALGQGKLTCFSSESGVGICCDQRLRSCATLSR